MYGVESCVHPDYRGRGVGSLLMEARFDVLRRLNLRGLIAGSIPMDYHNVAASMAVEDYVREVVEGKRFDTNLSKQLHKGFQVHNLIPEYIHDMRSLNWAVAIVWDNPAYEPGKLAEAPLFEVPRLYRTQLRSGLPSPTGAAGS
ncbi:MAG: GNAT family N-acetyltransferase [Anaerolineae bacterium]|nr:GNAT family N-acetyltransferase [Anaerolineae bacterium]